MERLYALLRSLAARRRAFQLPLLLIAFVGFTAGCVVSFLRLDVSPGDISLGPLLLLTLVLVPLTIAYSAMNMSLMGRAAGGQIGFLAGVRVSVYAQVAELLPIPGGAIVRTTALMKAGGTALQSTCVVLAFAFLWIACAACGAAFALAETGWLAIILGCSGVAGAVVLYIWLAHSFGHSVAVSAVVLRVLGLGLLALRLATAFVVIGATIPLTDSLTFAFATIVGSAASIVPAGLGVSEGLSALLAGPAGVVPAAGFLAVAISRLAGIAVSMIAAAVFTLMDRLTKPQTAKV